MKKCPFCAEEIQDEAIRCKHCHERLDVAASDVTAESAKRWRGTRLFVAVGMLLLITIIFVSYVKKRHDTKTELAHASLLEKNDLDEQRNYKLLVAARYGDVETVGSIIAAEEARIDAKENGSGKHERSKELFELYSSALDATERALITQKASELSTGPSPNELEMQTRTMTLRDLFLKLKKANAGASTTSDVSVTSSKIILAKTPNTKAGWKSKYYKSFPSGAIVTIGDFKSVFGKPSKSQTLGQDAYWYYDCSDGKIQVVLNNPDTFGEAACIMSINDY